MKSFVPRSFQDKLKLLIAIRLVADYKEDASDTDAVRGRKATGVPIVLIAWEQTSATGEGEHEYGGREGGREEPGGAAQRWASASGGA